eukprot:3432738-Rhodomonas_salina.1
MTALLSRTRSARSTRSSAPAREARLPPREQACDFAAEFVARLERSSAVLDASAGVWTAFCAHTHGAVGMYIREE